MLCRLDEVLRWPQRGAALGGALSQDLADIVPQVGLTHPATDAETAQAPEEPAS